MTKKSRILYIQQYLEQHTDENHPATIAQIEAFLKTISISANRKAVASDIDILIEYGVDVICNRGRRNEYFIGDRHFELPELKLLVDAVQASKFISAKKSKVLIDKLTSFASMHQASELKRNLFIEKQVKAKNEGLYRTVDLLNKAINSKMQVQFKYYDYSPQKKKVYKHGGKIYEFSPYGLIWNSDSYYVVGFSDSHGKVTKFRVDRIATAKITTESAVAKPAGFDIARYARGVFQMFDGPMREVALKCDNDLMTVMIDRFGENVRTDIADQNHFVAHVNVSVSPTFFGWIFSFAGRITIISPTDVAYEYFDTLKIRSSKSL